MSPSSLSPSRTAPEVSRWGAAPGRERITYQPRGDQAGSNAGGRAVEAAWGAPRALTLLTAAERTRFDAVVGGACVATHIESVAALGAALRGRGTDGVLVSAAALAAGGMRALAGVAELGKAHATTPLVVVVAGEVAPAVLVALGRSGARAVLDVRGAAGWGVLQTLWPSIGVRTLAQRAGALLEGPLAGVTPGMRQFVVGLFEAPARVRTVRSYAPRFGVLPTTMMSRFFRAGLPAPRRYLALARLVRAAQLFESSRWTVGAVAAELEHSSAQAFSRHLYLQLRVRPREFRRRYDAEGMVGRFAEEVIVPYQDVLQGFEPFFTRRDGNAG